MRNHCLGVLALLAASAVAIPAGAQQQGGSKLDVIPEKLPFDIPYGPPIGLAEAQSAIQAAVSEATRRGWPMNVAVLDSGANLIAFVHMDGAQLASISIAQHKARTAVKYRRPTRIFEEAIQKGGYVYLMTLDDVIASRGGIPLVQNGRIIGAIGCSGGTGLQDETVCKAGVAAIK